MNKVQIYVKPFLSYLLCFIVHFLNQHRLKIQPLLCKKNLGTLGYDVLEYQLSC